MQEPIEISIETKDGIADCRIEPIAERKNIYEITILYPASENGFGRSAIFCNEMIWDESDQSFYFENRDNEIHPKIKALESMISKAFINSLKGK